MIILGLNYGHANSAACIIKDGILCAAVEEERLSRIKNDSNFPINAIKYCLASANVNINSIDLVTVNSNKSKNIKKKIFFLLKNFSLNNIIYSLNFFKKINLFKVLQEEFGFKNRKKIFPVEHHLSHIASSFFCSGFENAVGLSIDGSGDFSTLLVTVCKDNNIYERERVYFPNSLGLFYQSLTQFLGFLNYGDEYKVMGLSAYGKDAYNKQISELIQYDENKLIKTNKKFFYFSKNLKLFELKKNSILFINLYLKKNFEKLFGFKNRDKNQKIEQCHKDLAHSLQSKYEEIFLKILNKIFYKYNIKNLVLSGGCAMNSLANGKILKNTPFEKLYIQPAAHDAGGALGSALYASEKFDKKNFLNKKYNSFYLGPNYKNTEIEKIIEKYKQVFHEQNIETNYYNNFNYICDITSSYLIKNKIIGWFQGRCEWGSRALGNRSILANPQIENFKEILNLKIKKRENFRPFAPSVMLEHANQWFYDFQEDPFMMTVCKVKENKIKIIPSVTHVDNTARIQTVSKKNNEKYYQLIQSFYKKSDCPILLNTSFNENEPIVCSPIDALNTFLKTKIDVLVLENYIFTRSFN